LTQTRFQDLQHHQHIHVQVKGFSNHTLAVVVGIPIKYKRTDTLLFNDVLKFWKQEHAL
jgi:hypothetical protein